MAKIANNARGAMLLLNLIQVTESISGSVVPLAMFTELLQIFTQALYVEQEKRLEGLISSLVQN